MWRIPCAPSLLHVLAASSSSAPGDGRRLIRRSPVRRWLTIALDCDLQIGGRMGLPATEKVGAICSPPGRPCCRVFT